MKFFWQISLLISVLTLTACGGKKSNDPTSNQISTKYPLQAFDDVNNKSTLDLEKLKDLPRVIDLKEDMTAVRDQGERGTCSFFAAIALAESAVKKKMNVEVNLSEEYLNYVVKSKGKGYRDDREGGSPIQNLKVAVNNKDGFLLEKDWPYQPSWFKEKNPCLENLAKDKKAPAICFSHNAPPESVHAKKISGDNFELSYIEAESTNEFISTIAQYRLPLSIVVPVNHRGWPDNGDVSYDEDMREECLKSESDCGFHVIVITGYDLDKKVFFFKNSWGKKWGHDGYGTMPFDVIDRHADQVSVTVKLKDSINLPKDYDKDPIALKDFSVSSKELPDHSVQIKTFGKIDNIGFHTVVTSSTLVKKSSSIEEAPNDENSPIAELSKEEEKKYKISFVSNRNFNFPEKELTSLEWNQENPNIITFPTEQMLIPTISDLKFFKDNELLIRTSLYLYSDDSGYKLLKRYYHPLNY